GERSAFAEATAQEAAAGIGVSSEGGPSGRAALPLSAAAKRTASENQAPLGRRFGFFSQLRTAGPRDPRPASPDTGLLQHLGYQVQSHAKPLSLREPGESASWNTTIRC